jgi:hypothetical protein
MAKNKTKKGNKNKSTSYGIIKKRVDSKPTISYSIDKSINNSNFKKTEIHKIDGENKEVTYYTNKYFTKTGKKISPPDREEINKRKKLEKEKKYKEDLEYNYNNLRDKTFLNLDKRVDRLNKLQKEKKKLTKIKNKKSKDYIKKEKKLVNSIQKTLEDISGYEAGINLVEAPENMYLVKKMIANNGKTYYLKGKTQSDIDNIIRKIIETQTRLYGKDKVIKSYRIVDAAPQEYKLHFVSEEGEEALNKIGYDKYGEKLTSKRSKKRRK